MKRNLFCAALCALLSTPGLMAQTTPSAGEVNAPPAHEGKVVSYRNPQRGPAVPPFSHIGLSGGISTAGLNMQAAVNATNHLNIRGTGNFLQYIDNNITASGFTASATLTLASAGAMLDYYPWARHGFRLSGGALLYNNNGVEATMKADGGTSFDLNDYTYYSSKANPVTGVASLKLNKEKVAPMFSLGWGNIIPRSGGHWSFPLEVGAAYIGEPQVNMALVSGQVCQDTAGTIGCVNVVGNTDVTKNLNAQIVKSQNDVNVLKFYPIISFGVGFSFAIR